MIILMQDGNSYNLNLHLDRMLYKIKVENMKKDMEMIKNVERNINAIQSNEAY